MRDFWLEYKAKIIMFIALVVIAGSVIAYIDFLKFQRDNARSRLEAAQIELKDWKKVYSILSEKVVEQNAAIQELDNKRKEAVSKRTEADKKAKAIAAQARARENAVASVPASSGTCEAELEAIGKMLEAAK